ncbi:MAG: galactokinase [Oscillospiraceae bacterium]
MNINEKELVKLYGEDQLERQKARYAATEEGFVKEFGAQDGIRVFSAPGRTEVSGNHTDHNNGKVLAAAVNLDIIAYTVPTDDGIITVKSEGYPLFTVDTKELEPKEDEKDSTPALVRGVAAGFANNGLKIGGFKAYMTSDVMKGSGVSSSAAFEVLVASILSGLYNNNAVSAVKAAQISQYAENVYFGKPSGLLDQMAASVGGFVYVDFQKTQYPIIVPIEFNISKYGYTLCIVDTKGSHADLTPEYAAIPAEMKSVAAALGKTVLREADEEEFFANIAELRKKCGDRAVLRAAHFFDENRRVEKAADALKSGDIDTFLEAIKASGNSSYKFLQNVYANKSPEEQGVAIGLYTAERVLGGKGASRVHGGGFAGTIQAFVPNELLDEFVKAENAVFGEGSCHKLFIRPVGGTEINA